MTSALSTTAAAPAFAVSREQAHARPQTFSSWLGVALLLCHIPFAIIAKKVPALIVLHALATLSLGLWWALTGQRVRVAYSMAYLAGSEVLWRMTNTSSVLPWEFSKYGLALLALVDLVRSGRFSIRLLPLGYFLLLVPAAFLTVMVWEGSKARGALSFNLSGPLALTMCVAFFSRLHLSGREWLKLLLVVVGPMLGVASLALHHLSTTAVTFGQSSNVEAAGGFGPNQVSSALGFGLLCAFFCVVDKQLGFRVKLVCLAAILVFAVESALTMSRSGLYLAIASVSIATFFLAQQPGVRLYLIVVGMAAAFFVFVIYPQVDAFTGGAISARFKNTKSTGRDSILLADLKIFQENPILGVGVGVAKQERKRFYRGTAAHTEFTRVLAEHGMLGIGALCCLFLMPVRPFLQARSAPQRAVVMAFTCYAFMFMAVNGMRLAMPSFAFGLAAVSFGTAVTRRSRKSRTVLSPARATVPSSRSRPAVRHYKPQHALPVRAVSGPPAVFREFLSRRSPSGGAAQNPAQHGKDSPPA